MKSNPVKVREIGEIAIRCADIDIMFEFYTDIVGLEVLADTRDEGIAFLKICDGYGGHTTILALFLPTAGRDELHPKGTEPPHTGAKSSLHHLALTIEWTERSALREWLGTHKISYRVQPFDWIGWEGTFIEDPEGNTIEFVAANPLYQAQNS